jgi:hypothetical protein
VCASFDEIFLFCVILLQVKMSVAEKEFACQGSASSAHFSAFFSGDYQDAFNYSSTLASAPRRCSQATCLELLLFLRNNFASGILIL